MPLIVILKPSRKPLLKPISALLSASLQSSPSRCFVRYSRLNVVSRCSLQSTTSVLLKRRRRWFFIKSSLKLLRKSSRPVQCDVQVLRSPSSLKPLSGLLRKVLQAMIEGQHSSHELLQDLYQTLVKIFASIPRIFSRARGCGRM
ncbi:hypothetical protein R3P38DRAFT_2770937 [Favolaschia claudopus]|uniref:Uncharacterized protein n=1 Tax=Favolaschia claudopus TaxID=2862362 RepID=A0AAW0CCQ0_9AGAR